MTTCSRSDGDRPGTTLANIGALDSGVATFIQRQAEEVVRPIRFAM
jgi:hypothetical protein